MIFKLFNKPKWEHRESAVRMQAVPELRPERAADAEILAQLATKDGDTGVRVAATKRLTDIALLHLLMTATDTPPPVTEVAAQRWLKFAAQDCDAAQLAARREQIDALTDNKMLEHLARNAASAELRLHALGRIDKESVATDLTINDTDARVRAAALAKVTQISALERIIKAVRTKDKASYQTAKAKLETAVEAVERPKRLRAQADKLIAQIEQVPLNGDHAFQTERFAELRQEWSTLEDELDADTRARGVAAGDRTSAHLHQQRQALEAKRAAEAAWIPARDARDRLLLEAERTLSGIVARMTSDDAFAQGVELALTELNSQWTNAGVLPDDEARAYDARWARAQRTVREELKTLQLTSERASEMQSWVNQAREQGSADALNHSVFQRLQRHLKRAHETPPRLQPLWNEFEELMRVLIARAAEQEKAQKLARQQFEKHIAALEKAVDDGHLDDAIRAHRDAQKTMREAGELSQGIRHRWHAVDERFVKLRDWRNWANTPQKERLIAQVEALIGSDEDPAEIARLVRAAREEWHRLGGGATDADTAEALWQRFNSACEACYAPAKEFFAEQAQQRAQSAEARDLFLTKLEEFINGADWAHIDWRKVERLTREAPQEWRALGVTDRKARKGLDERFDAAYKTLKDKLHAEWARNIELKEALIARMTALHEKADDQALNTVKQANKQWKDIGHAGHRKEQALWKAFRAACDEVFARHRALQDQARAARDQQRANKVAIIEKVEQLCTLSLDETLAAHGAAQPLQAQWDELAAAEKPEADLQRRFDDALRTWRDAQARARVTKEQLIEQRLVQKSAICAELEAALERGEVDTATLDGARARWQAVGTAWEDDAVNARFNHVLNAAQDATSAAAWRASLGANLQQRLQMALQLEILADAETPESYKSARMQYQVERLKNGLGQRANIDAQQEYRRLLAGWYTHGAIPAIHVVALESRISAVRDLMRRRVTQGATNKRGKAIKA